MTDSNILKNAGLKITTPRVQILKILEDSSHLSAEEIYQISLKKGHETIGMGTIYRVLTQFENVGLIKRHNFESGKAVFELNDSMHHDHMVCVESGEIIEFQNEEIEELQEKIAKQYGYELIDHSLVLYVKKK